MTDEPASTSRAGMFTVLAIALAIPLGLTLWNSLQSEAEAPTFVVTDTGLRDGQFGEPMRHDLDALQGKTVVIDFMAYNCAACRWTTPNVVDPLWEAYHNETEFVLLSIDAGKFSQFPGSTHDNLIAWQQEFDSPWPHALDETGVFLDYLEVGAFGLPAMFVIGPDGAILDVQNGRPDLDQLRAAVDTGLAGSEGGVPVLQVGVIGLAAIAGAASFFAPCSVGLIPAYMGFLLQRTGRQGIWAGVVPGLVTTAGIVAVYGVLAIIIWQAGDWLAPLLPHMAIAMGILFVLMGILLLVGFDWEPVAKRLGLGKVDGRKGFFAFGVGYGLAAFGCTGPVFLPVLILGFSESTAVGFVTFLVYSLAVASLVVFAAYLVAVGQHGRLRKLLSHTKTITRVTAVLLIIAGVYLFWFDATAFGLI